MIRETEHAYVWCWGSPVMVVFRHNPPMSAQHTPSQPGLGPRGFGKELSLSWGVQSKWRISKGRRACLILEFTDYSYFFIPGFMGLKAMLEESKGIIFFQ